MAAASCVWLTPVLAQQAGGAPSRHSGPQPKRGMRDGLQPSKEGSCPATIRQMWSQGRG